MRVRCGGTPVPVHVSALHAFLQRLAAAMQMKSVSTEICAWHRVCDRTVTKGRQFANPYSSVGAAHTSKEWLLFMHADCQLPKGYFESMKSALEAQHGSRRQLQWGCFCTIETGEASMKLVQWGVRMRTWMRGQPYGDQGLFCSSQAFKVAHPCWTECQYQFLALSLPTGCSCSWYHLD